MSGLSGVILSSLTTFLTDLQEITARLVTFCTEDTQEFNRDIITAIGDLMDDLADMYLTLGYTETGERIRYGKVYTDKVMVRVFLIDEKYFDKIYIQAQLEKLESLGLETSALNICSEERDISAAAETMEDLAALIEEVGIQNLDADLALDFTFNPPR